jgi:hypothetical protein
MQVEAVVGVSCCGYYTGINGGMCGGGVSGCSPSDGNPRVGGGGSQTSGGAAGVTVGYSSLATTGSQYTGGNGALYGGGGGGGYYGGGGGGVSSYNIGGGGGGSGYIGGCLAGSYTQPGYSGLTISATVAAASSDVSYVSGSSSGVSAVGMGGAGSITSTVPGAGGNGRVLILSYAIGKLVHCELLINFNLLLVMSITKISIKMHYDLWVNF